MKGILEKTSTRKKCKHGIRKGQWTEGILEKVVSGDMTVPLISFEEISIGDQLYVYCNQLDIMRTGPIEKLRIIDDYTLEFITDTESFRFEKEKHATK